MGQQLWQKQIFLPAVESSGVPARRFDIKDLPKEAWELEAGPLGQSEFQHD